MIDDPLTYEAPSARPVWLITLADLSLLLIGFFVLLQAQHDVDPRELARGLAAGFGVEAPPIAVASQSVEGFAPGSAALPGNTTALAAWARTELRDPRVRLTVTGATDGSAADRDPVSGSATALAADRARAVVAALVRDGVADTRIDIAAAPTFARRATFVTLAFTGEQEKRQ
ncbi:flagellar motor protein MotB [Sphingomonas sp.]|jgi:flagellar motor protein MotB|uniref:flagellar motor protein MotB n=1 Tax=Sphingomonas sp. TaxID=28214 RepID=UPI0035C859E5